MSSLITWLLIVFLCQSTGIWAHQPRAILWSGLLKTWYLGPASEFNQHYQVYSDIPSIISCHLKPKKSDSLIMCASPWNTSVVFGVRRFTNVSPAHSRIGRCQVVLHDVTVFGVRAARGRTSKLGNPIWVKKFWHIWLSFANWSTDIYCSCGTCPFPRSSSTIYSLKT
jgi:hypothetical protein